MGKVSAIFLTILFMCGVVSGVDLVKDGKLLFDGIVTPDKPVPSVAHAAQELYYHVRQAAACSLPIVVEGAVEPGKRYIYLGRCGKNENLNPAGLPWNTGVINITSGAIHIAGNDGNAPLYAGNNSTGTLFAVYEFLEKYLGVRWLWPGELGEIIPELRTITIPEGTAVYRPLLRTSGFRGGVKKRGAVTGWHSEKNMENFFKAERLWLLRHRFSLDKRFIGGHAFRTYYDRYHKTDPDFFSMLPDGTRRPNPWKWSRKTTYVSMCASNPRLAETVVKNWQKSGAAGIINVNENDSAGECVCDACLVADNSSVPAADRRAAAKRLFDRHSRKWPFALGNVSGRYCKLFLDVQKRADEIQPGNLISGLIYANYSEPPDRSIKLNDRIILRFCPPFMYPWPQEKIDRYKRIWEGWANSGAKLIFRPNFASDGHYFPIMFHEVFYDLFTFAARRGMVGSDIDSCTGQYAAQALPNYVIAALNHRVGTPLAQMEDEYYSAFGAAGGKIKEYTQYMKELSMNPGLKDPFTQDPVVEGGLLFRKMILVADEVFTPQAVAKAEKLLDDAAKIPDLDKKSARRVRMLQDGIEHIKLAMAAQVEFRKYQAGGSEKAFMDAWKKLDDFRAAIESSGIMNMSHIRELDNLSWNIGEKLRRLKKE